MAVGFPAAVDAVDSGKERDSVCTDTLEECMVRGDDRDAGDASQEDEIGEDDGDTEGIQPGARKGDEADTPASRHENEGVHDTDGGNSADQSQSTNAELLRDVVEEMVPVGRPFVTASPPLEPAELCQEDTQSDLYMYF